MAYRSATSGSNTTSTAIAVTVPAGVALNDIVLVVVSQDSAPAVTIGAPAGFTQLDTFSFATGTPDGNQMRLFWKRATASEGASYAFTSTVSGATSPIGWACAAFSGRDTGNPPTNSKASSTAANATGSAITAATVTALAGDDAAWIACMDVNAVNIGNGITPNASYTERVDLIDGGGGWINIEISTRDNLSAGATGSVAGSGTLSSGGFGWVVFLVRMPAAPTGINADLTGTLDALTSASTATVDIAAAVAKTLDDATSVAAGTVDIIAAVAQTLDALTSVATATIDLNAALTKTLDPVTGVATFTQETTADVTQTLADATGTAAVTVDVAADVTQTLDAVTAASAATVDVLADVTQTLAALTAVAAATVDVAAVTASTLDAMTVVATLAGTPTRIYLPSTGTAALPALGFAAGWNKTSQAVRGPASLTKTNSALVASASLLSTAANPELHCGKQFQLTELAAQTINGTVKGQIRTSANNAAFNGTLAIAARVVSSDGLTLRGTLVAPVGSPTATTPPRMTITNTNRPFLDASDNAAIPVSSVTCLDHDILVVEIGVRDADAGTTRSASLAIGDVAATADLPEDSTTTTNLDPWIEFSSTIAFVISGISADVTQTLGAMTATATGTIDIAAAVDKTLDALTSVGAGTVDLTADVTATLDSMTASATATIALQGAVDSLLEALTSQATATVTDRVDLTLGATFADMTADAVLAVEIRAFLAGTFDPMTVVPESLWKPVARVGEVYTVGINVTVTGTALKPSATFADLHALEE